MVVLYIWLEEGNIKAVGSHAHHLLFFVFSSSLLFILWLMNVKEEKKGVVCVWERVPRFKAAACSSTTPQSKGFPSDDQKLLLGPSIILTIISCIYMKTHLSRPFLTKQMLKVPFSFFSFFLFFFPLLMITTNNS